MEPAKQLNPDAPLRSILRSMPGSPSDRIGLLCSLSGLDRTSLAAAVGVHYVTLSRVVNGHTDDPGVKARIAGRLGVTVEDIWPPSPAAAGARA